MNYNCIIYNIFDGNITLFIDHFYCSTVKYLSYLLTYHKNSLKLKL